MWLEPSNRRPIDPDPDAGPRLALIFSSRINIRDPKDFLHEISEIQNTQIEKPDTGDIQYVYRDIQGRVGNTLVFCFVAPSALDTFTPVRLSQQSPLSAPWTELPLKVSQEGVPSLQQVISGPAVVCPPIVLPAPQPSPVLPHSARTIQKATIGSILSPPQFDTRADSFQGGNALTKFRFARQLLLQPGEVCAVQQHLTSDSQAATNAVTFTPKDSMWELLALFEADPHSSSPPPPLSTLIDVPINALSAFGETVSELRKHAVNLASSSVPNQEMQSKEDTAMPDGEKAVQNVQQVDPRMLAALSHAAAIANKGLSLNLSLGVLPIGYINLERLEMAPAGIVRGELIATIPLAPLEETAVVQKEWSVTSKEFTSIVTDSLENYSETGVTDNTELAQSTTSQNQHSNQFNITGTVSGGIPVINGSVTSSFGAQDTNSQSATDSRKHAVSLTEKASLFQSLAGSYVGHMDTLNGYGVK